MNFLENIISQAEADIVKVEAAVKTVAPEVKAAVSGAKALLTSPDIAALVSFFESFTTHTATPGAAVVVEPSVSS